PRARARRAGLVAADAGGRAGAGAVGLRGAGADGLPVRPGAAPVAAGRVDAVLRPGGAGHLGLLAGADPPAGHRRARPGAGDAGAGAGGGGVDDGPGLRPGARLAGGHAAGGRAPRPVAAPAQDRRLKGGAVKDVKPIVEAPDPLLHEPRRLALVSVLAAAPALTFTELRDTLGMTDGNLSVHLQKLEEKGYVAIDKQVVGRRPQPTCRLTAAGREAFSRYLDTLEAIVKQGRALRAGA